MNIGEIIPILKKYFKNNAYKKNIFIGLSGGRSFDQFYPLFIDFLEELEEDIRGKIRFGFVDERVVPADDSERNSHQVMEKFFSHLMQKNLISPNQIITIDERNSYISGDYSDKIERFDIAFFGAGEDGHIASLFPNHPLLDDEKKTFLEIFDSPKYPAHRVTLSKNMIQDIEIAFVFFIGEGKKDALRDFEDKNISPQNLPAKYICNAKKYFVVSRV